MTHAIEVHGGDYEHVLTLSGLHYDIDVSYVIGRPRDIFASMLKEQAYEACEFSLSNYLMLKDRGADWLQALPVFPYRAFRHSTLFVRADSAFRGPVDLPGKRIGVPDFSMTAAVWTRGILADQYGVPWTDLRWVVSGRQRFPALPGVTIEQVETDLEEDLIAGRIDVLLTTAVADDRNPPSARRLRPLIADVQHAEERYFREFGIYPINHVVVIRADALARLPRLPRALFDAYSQAKAQAYRRKLGTTLLPWGARYWHDVFEQFGGDPLPYGLCGINRMVVDRLIKHLHDQKLISRPLDIDALFIEPE